MDDRNRTVIQLYRTWKVATSGTQCVSNRRHWQDNVQVVSALVDEILPDAFARWSRTVSRGIVPYLNYATPIRVYSLMPRLHQDTCRPETCIPDEQLVSGYMLTHTCRRIHVSRSGYMLTVSRRHNYYSFMSRSSCIPLYPATDGRQTGNSFVANTSNMLTATSGYNLYPATCILV